MPLFEWGNKVPDPEKLSRHVIQNDRWDAQDVKDARESITTFAEERERFGLEISSGEPLFDDVMCSLLRVAPELLDPKQIRPAFLVHWRVMVEAMGLTDWERMRSLGSVGDVFVAATATTVLSQPVIDIYKRLGDLQEKAEKLDQKLSQAFNEQSIPDPSAGEESEDEDSERQPGGPGDSETDDQQPESGNQQDGPGDSDSEAESDPESETGNLEAEIEQLINEIDDRMPEVRVQLSRGMQKAVEQVEDDAAAMAAWGLEPGVLQQMDPEERLALAEQIHNNPKLKQMTKLIGVMKPLAFAELRQRVRHGVTEVSNLTRGNNLSRVLPSELARFRHPTLKALAAADYIDSKLLSYSLEGSEKQARGGMVVLRDESSSMGYQGRDVWAGAASAVLLQVAKAQNRPFRGIVFSGTGQMRTWEFNNALDFTPERMIEFTTCSFHGGTSFEGPYTRALEWLEEDWRKRTTVRSDIVMITDGECDVSDSWKLDWQQRMNKIDARSYGVLIGTTPTEPLISMCNGQVLTARDLSSGVDLSNVFRGVV